MEKIKAKDNFISKIEQYKNLVFSICLKLTGDYFAAEDITQETFLTVYQHLDEFDGSSEKAWICRIASNKCIDYLREQQRKSTETVDEELTEAIPDRDDGPLKQVICLEVVETFRGKCDELKEPYRTIARMHFVEELTAREISEKTGVPLKTIQTQILRAREMLKKKIRKEDLLE